MEYSKEEILELVREYLDCVQDVKLFDIKISGSKLKGTTEELMLVVERKVGSDKVKIVEGK